MSRFCKGRYISFCLVCIVVIGIFANAIYQTGGMDPFLYPFLFPTLTFSCWYFTCFVPVFMLMKYWCDRKRLYLVAIAFAFAGSALLMIGTLSVSRPGWISINSMSSTITVG